MQKIRSHRRLLFMILIPPVLVTCFCVAFLIPRVSNFFRSSADPDYLWSRRITKVLSDKGYPVHDVRISDSEPPGLRILDVQTGNLVDGEAQKAYQLVKEVHSVVMETYTDESAQPQPVKIINVVIFDVESGIYSVLVDYETVRKFYKGEVSEQTYFEHWAYPENAPEIIPPWGF